MMFPETDRLEKIREFITSLVETKRAHLTYKELNALNERLINEIIYLSNQFRKHNIVKTDQKAALAGGYEMRKEYRTKEWL